MTDEELCASLEARQALIVHFSHHAAMRGTLVFPDDLSQVLVDNKNWPLSCSVVTPEHKMDPVGSVGVILRPRSPANILSVYHADAGAYEVNAENQAKGSPLSQASFDASLDKVEPGGYNEWRVRGAEPVGLFVHNPDHIEVRRSGTYEGPYGQETAIAPVTICITVVKEALPDWPIFTMTPNGPLEL